MKLSLYIITLIIACGLFISCDCHKVECVDNPSIFIDIKNNKTGESLLFGENAMLSISSVNVFAIMDDQIINLPKVELTNTSISPDPFLNVNLEALPNSRFFISTDTLTTDTIDIIRNEIPSSSCCDMSFTVNGANINGAGPIYFASPLVLFR